MTSKLEGAGSGGNRNADGLADHIRQGADEKGRIIEAGHHLKLAKAGNHGLLAHFPVNLIERFNVIGNKGDGNHQSVADALRSKLGDDLMDRGADPARGADLALVSERGGQRPAAPFQNTLHGCFGLRLIGVAGINNGRGNAVGAENQMDPA